MILKVSQNFCFTRAGWYIRSGIVSVDYSSRMSGITSSETLADSWLKEEDEGTRYSGSGIRKYFPPVKEHLKDKMLDEWIRLIVNLANGSREEWIVQAESYLLNDDGKTIERIF